MRQKSNINKLFVEGRKLKYIVILSVFFCFINLPQHVFGKSSDIHKIHIKVEKKQAGAPLTFGLPFPKGELYSPDNVIVRDSDGNIIPSQITKVITWEPADQSIQWIWVFIFASGDEYYTVEYGSDVQRKPIKGDKIKISNHWGKGRSVVVNTGEIKFNIQKGIGGFLDKVKLDRNNNGFNKSDLIAESPEEGRGSFLDILDKEGLDPSKAEVTYAKAEKGSGPLHLILLVKGVYHYSHNNNSPFEMRIHAYAGKSYLRVLYTNIYTGIPTQHELLKGEHAIIATTLDTLIINEDSLANAHDPSWTKPNDQIAKMGLNLKYNLEYPLHFMTSYHSGDWWMNGDKKYYQTEVEKDQNISIFQTGLKPLRLPPLPNSTPTKRIDGFKATVTKNGKEEVKNPEMDGWIDVSSKKWGISVGIRNFLKEYPKEIALNTGKDLLHAYAWPDKGVPMGFPRFDDSTIVEGMLDNLAQGIGKTTEMVFYFHGPEADRNKIENTVDYFLDPPVAHANPKWYTSSKVFGSIAPADTKYKAYERGLDYKYDWILYNQKWEPWYGMWDYGGTKTYYFNHRWYHWANNEPAQDFMWWLEFMRTGDRKYFLQAEAMSRQTMDVNNTHWPKTPKYRGDTNPSINWFKTKNAPKGSPYVGTGLRHGRQHWIARLSAHVWVPGWVTYYLLTGYHRALEVAKETGNAYLRRIWGKHGLRGRRLYLSVWNLDWIFNATKNPKYLKELKFRANTMMRLQKTQAGNLVIHRYGYSQVYASHGLDQYLNFTGITPGKVKSSIVDNARRLRDVPPWDHSYESYLSSIHALILGYKYTHEKSFIKETLHRAKWLKMDRLPKPVSSYKTQKALVEALDKASNMPKLTSRYEQRGIKPIWRFASGMRVFGWTHAFSVPWLIYWLNQTSQQ